MRLGIAIVLTNLLLVTLTGSRLELAVNPAQPPPIRTPACPQPAYPDANALLAVLPQASYDCTEQIAVALRPRVELSHIDHLLAIAANTGFDARTRRNALRILGRLAESGRATRAGELMQQKRAVAARTLAINLLERETDNFLLQDAVWLLDGFYYPGWDAAPALAHIALSDGYAPALRYRAARARTRLMVAEQGGLRADSRQFLIDALHSSDPGTRTAAAEALSFLRDEQLGAPEPWQQAVEEAIAAAPPLTIATDDGDPRGARLFTFLESSPTVLTARAALARAADRLAGEWTTTPRLWALQAAYESLALPVEITTVTITLRTGPATVTDSQELLAVVANAYRQARELLGASGETAIPGEEPATLQVLIFPSQAAYRDYMRAFTPFTVDVDGIYDAQTGTLYSFRRGIGQTANTLTETLRHETSHAVTAAYVFPGHWLSLGYHNEPKGWFDEGLAEVLTAQSNPDGPLQFHERHLSTLCAAPYKPVLADLLARREGYDRYGTFDYPAAWALLHFLLSEHPQAVAALADAWRSQAYRLSDWPRLAGWPDLTTAEADWHAAMVRWCR
ncbi:MAG: collagenase [Chloroflexus sp.]|uniref:collagenase n=1 Tax=Chloroflexus sp. TaxID=1904827 RepID=UPI00404942DD